MSVNDGAAQKRGFVTGQARPTRPADPESLFRILKRDAAIPHLWSHQADILRLYYAGHLGASDVALELPTGDGKTLVGLLVAEYRRRAYDERVVYLCPTRQLVHQVVAHAGCYGVPARALLPPAYTGLNEFNRGEVVGVATYRSIFNTNPRVRDPHVIILDDAHASEDHIAGLWSVTIQRRTQEATYRRVVELLRGEMQDYLVARLLNDQSPRAASVGVELLAFPRLWKHVGALRDLLDSELASTNARYAWAMISDHLQACCLYLSWHELLLRPIIPPTLTHEPFAEATQRIYMSATLGEGGELERICGVRRIERIATPKGHEQQNTGRRLVLFPGYDREGDATEEIAPAIKLAGRGLVLVPRAAEVSQITALLSAQDISVFAAKDIEESLDSFTSQNGSALVLANRYDGLDLPGNACRLLVMQGLPVGTNLQERFLLERLGASLLLRDRLRTRLVQGVGRCCRHDGDYAAVLLLGQQLYDFCARMDNLTSMHSQLQAEIAFGLDNSKDVDTAALLDLLSIFYSQDETWQDAEADIQSRASEQGKVTDAFTSMLSEVVQAEVGYIYELWKRNYSAALEKAIAVSDKLGGNSTPISGYRAWWYYLAGNAAWLSGKEDQDHGMLTKAGQLYERASRNSHSISWFAGLAREVVALGAPLVAESDPAAADTLRACEAVYATLKKLGSYGARFEKQTQKLLQNLGQTANEPFEEGLKLLGELLGFEAHRPDDTGAPDSVWQLSDQFAIAVEAKSDEQQNEPLSLATVRQAATHENWVRAKCSLSSVAGVITVVVSPRTKIHPDAHRNAANLYYVNMQDVRTLAQAVVAALFRVRAQTLTMEPVSAIETIRDELRRAGLLPMDIKSKLCKTPLSALPLS